MIIERLIRAGANKRKTCAPRLTRCLNSPPFCLSGIRPVARRPCIVVVSAISDALSLDHHRDTIYFLKIAIT
jgi:hypothetical protein